MTHYLMIISPFKIYNMNKCIIYIYQYISTHTNYSLLLTPTSISLSIFNSKYHISRTRLFISF